MNPTAAEYRRVTEIAQQMRDLWAEIADITHAVYERGIAAADTDEEFVDAPEHSQRPATPDIDTTLARLRANLTQPPRVPLSQRTGPYVDRRTYAFDPADDDFDTPQWFCIGGGNDIRWSTKHIRALELEKWKRNNPNRDWTTGPQVGFSPKKERRRGA
jgi:hypothetical protein